MQTNDESDLQLQQKTVEAFIAGKVMIDELLSHWSEPRAPAAEAFRLLSRACGEQNLADRDAALAAARSIPYRDLDPLFAQLFLSHWIFLCFKMDRKHEAEVLLKEMRALLPEDAPPEFHAHLLFQEAGYAGSQEGNHRLEEALLRKVLLTAKHSPRYFFYLRALGLFIARFGRLREFESEMAILAQHADNNLVRPSALDIIRMMNAMQTGHAEEALALIERVRSDPISVRLHAQALDLYQVIGNVMLDRWNPKDFPAGQAKIQSFAQSTALLRARQPESALAIAHTIVNENPIFHHRDDIDAFMLLRAELACGHRAAALRLLEERRTMGNINTIDSLFWARAEALGERMEEAARHMAAAFSAAERYDATPRLDFELALACELTPGVLARLSRTTGLLSIAPDQPQNPNAPEVVSASLSGVGRLLGSSPGIEEVRRSCLRCAALDVPILITGETGTGKEVAARAIHEEGPRVSEPFVAVNCGAIAESLLESELFGHQRGAFTGATRTRLGVFEAAGAGTILLDEIGEIAPRLQVALLRVLETGEIRPVGSHVPRKVRCRILAATNASLDSLVLRDAFRKDLYFRLRRMEIAVPPLRDRAEDIPLLATYFLNEGRNSATRATISPELAEALARHPWPGNIRELRNQIERMRLLSSEKEAYEASDLSAEYRSDAAGSARRIVTSPEPSRPEPARSAPPAPLQNKRPWHLKARLLELFQTHECLGRGEAASLLGISNTTATRYLHELTAEVLIEKVEPTRSPRTHYFRRRQSS